MMPAMVPEELLAELDRRLAPVDAARLAAYPGEHTVDFAAIPRGFVKDAQALAGLLKKREEAVAARRRPAA